MESELLGYQWSNLCFPTDLVHHVGLEERERVNHIPKFSLVFEIGDRHVPFGPRVSYMTVSMAVGKVREFMGALDRDRRARDAAGGGDDAEGVAAGRLHPAMKSASPMKAFAPNHDL
eukprot:scaffold4647_cov393-Prasinococcus_capsulatus_cf.AAC.13